MKTVHTDSPKYEYQCEYCDYTFTRMNNLNDHLKSYCPVKFDKVYSCKVCNKQFERKVALQEHKEVHNEKEPIKDDVAKCNICDKTISRARDLKRHMKTHTRIVSKGKSHFSVDVQLIKCPKCSSHFKKTYNFERHMKSHHSEKFETRDNSNIVFYRDNFFTSA